MLLFPTPHYTNPDHRHRTGSKLLSKYRGIQAANLFCSLLENWSCTCCKVLYKVYCVAWQRAWMANCCFSEEKAFVMLLIID